MREVKQRSQGQVPQVHTGIVRWMWRLLIYHPPTHLVINPPTHHSSLSISLLHVVTEQYLLKSRSVGWGRDQWGERIKVRY